MAEENKKTNDRKKNKSKHSWSKGLKAEFAKIIWTDRSTLGKQTTAVVGISVVICLLITLIDSLGLQIMQLLIK